MAPYTQLYVHCVWATFGRLPLINPELEPRLYSVIVAKCTDLGCRTIALGGIEDHVHLLVCFPPTLAIADLLKGVKGSSSHFANHEIGGEAFKWQGGYGTFTISKRSIDSVVDYIKNQKIRHANRQLIDVLECTESEE